MRPCTHGKTREEAIRNGEEIIEMYLSSVTLGKRAVKFILNPYEGVKLKDYRTRPAAVKILTAEPNLPPRNPPIRYRKNVPTCWLEMTLTEGRNRQIRRMTAAVGFPTLRLVRVKISVKICKTHPISKQSNNSFQFHNFSLESLRPGEYRELTKHEKLLLQKLF